MLVSEFFYNDAAAKIESAVIGELLKYGDAAFRQQEKVVDEADFSVPLHAAVFGIAAKLAERQTKFDGLAVFDELSKAGSDEDTAALANHFQEYVDTAPSFEFVADHASRVHRNAVLRRASDQLRDASETARVGGDPAELSALIQPVVQSLDCADSRVELKSTVTLLEEARQRHEDIHEGRIAPLIPTGIRSIDELLGGGILSTGSLYLIGARPGMGKTALGLQLAQNMTARGNVLFASLEQPSTQISERLLALMTDTPTANFLDDKLYRQGEQKLETALQLAAKNRGQLFVTDDQTMTVRDIEAAAAGIEGLKAVFIDYLGLVSTGNPGANEDTYAAVTALSRALRLMARKLNIPVVCLAQLNRSVESRKDRHPLLSDLRDSGAIEQDADAVFLLFRPDYYRQEERGDNLVGLDVDIAKNRHGPTGIVRLAYALRTGSITDGNFCFGEVSA